MWPVKRCRFVLNETLVYAVFAQKQLGHLTFLEETEAYNSWYVWSVVCTCGALHCKSIRRFYGKITGNQLPVHFSVLFFFYGRP